MEIINNFFSLLKDVWKGGISGASFTDIIIALFVFFIFLLLRSVVSKYIVKKIEVFVSKSTNNFDNNLTTSLEGPVKFFPIVFGFFLASSFLELDGKSSLFVDHLNRSLVTILIFWFIHQLIQPAALLIKSIELILSRDLVNWIIRALKVLILILGFAATLEIWGIKIGPIIAGLGLFGVAVALGAQDLFKNLISGILVLVEKRFKVGDWIYVDGVIEGTVEDIGFRSTVVRKFDKALATIPNFQFAEKAVINQSETSHRRVEWMIGLEYKTTSQQLEQVRNKILDFIKEDQDFIISDTTPCAVNLNQFSASSIDILIRCYTKTNRYYDWLKVKDKFIIKIKQVVEDAGASFAFPSQSIYVEKFDK
ncbi:MAG: mechanosensitive ion channel protein MscS [Candidatus Pelagibacter sp.]|nr:mechanosensitive ion channel protein MscS [Candidatus Pelagibacter sp.]OUV87180.1 MAG: mechanosensitive ion channel protein MscS [Pelagibacteraceae bacterium TMED136]|tara:strand:+ start:1645 stop:2742 length:1098 start_codon:yes stop_codon:yes gene_type:complete